MSSKIQVLDEHTINKIAAGEVIENPASVVKELVENAIDAEASEITVEIKGGGRQLIRITDNGCGMSEDDALLCFERHATSKIRNVEDILETGTMGFRGEAVPSIASISKLTLITCPKGDDEGTLVIIEGGKILKTAPAARSQGTTFEIKSLFFNVPVRRKFQRSPTYDANEILKVLSIQALAHPKIKFQLINNQGTTLNTNTPLKETFQDQLGERITSVMGSEFFGGLTPIDKEEDDCHLTGFIGLPGYTRQNRTGQYLFINGRAVVSSFISQAIREGYGTSLATNRHPVFILHLNIPGALVDVNVHPQKREVRLRQEQDLREFISQAIEGALQPSGLQLIDTGSSSINFDEPVPQYRPDPIETPKDPETTKKTTTQSLRPTFSSPPPYQSYPPIDCEPLIVAEKPTPNSPPPLLDIRETPPPPKVVSTIKGYLILESDDGSLKLVDQRAAHTRILFEKIEKKQNTMEVQSLLIPVTLELTPIEAGALQEHIKEFERIGFEIAEFGPQSFAIQAVPRTWINTNHEKLVRDILKDVQEFQSSSTAQQEKKKLLSQSAARAAVSQKQTLSVQEGQQLVNQLYLCQAPYQCPFGKPTAIELSQEEIAKQFEKQVKHRAYGTI